MRIPLSLKTLGSWKEGPRWLSGSETLDWVLRHLLVLKHLLTDKETKSLEAEVSCLLKYNFQKDKTMSFIQMVNEYISQILLSSLINVESSKI